MRLPFGTKYSAYILRRRYFLLFAYYTAYIIYAIIAGRYGASKIFCRYALHSRAR